MRQKIDNTIGTINTLIDWYQKYRPDQLSQQFYDLVGKRLELRTISETLEENPGIAAYGESQKGKSYLMSNLLQDNGRPFMVVAPDREYNYVTELNPPGDGQEATGVVTRFTTFAGSDAYSPQYPVLMKVLRVHEIVAILADAYHRDVMDYKMWSDKDLEAKAKALIERYADAPVLQKVVVEDDIIFIKNYLRSYVNQAQNIYQSEYLDNLARVMRRVPINDWVRVFEPLWHSNPDVTGLLRKMIEVLRQLDFAREVYLPIDAIVHEQVKPRTIMSVQCLHGVYNPSFPHRTSAYLRSADGSFREIPNFNRSLLSAVCREVVLKVEERFSTCTMSYDTTMLPQSTRSKLQHTTFRRDILQHADLLDFPGARNRETLMEENLNKSDINTQEHNMIKLLLRGKIAYLFNHYNSARAINLLMFCHDTANVAVTSMYTVLDKWINRYVGDSPEARAATIRRCGGVAPFFVISTKFNQDMAYDEQQPQSNNSVALLQRWTNRFNILYKDSFHAGTDTSWFTSWDGPSSPFRNSYVLRDFKYSGVGGRGNNLYRGFNPENPREEELALPRQHYDNLRSTFIQSEDVNMFMDDPELNWDLSSTLNNDGSVYIIDRLTTVAERLAAVRNEQFAKANQEISDKLVALLDTLYIKTDGVDPVREARKRIGELRRAFIKAANKDNYFFGRLIEAIEMSIDEVYTVVYDAINDPHLVDTVHDTHDWEIIYKALEKCTTEEDAYNTLMDFLMFDTDEQLEKWAEEQQISLGKLLKRDFKAPRKSDVVAQRVLKAWTDKLSAGATVDRACGEALDHTSYGLMRERLCEIAEDMALVDKMSAAIADLVNVNNMSTVNQIRVADILALKINDFINDWGRSYRETSAVDSCRQLDEKHRLMIFDNISGEIPVIHNEDSLTALFSNLTANSVGITESFYSHYNEWMGYMALAILCKQLSGGTKIDNPEANDAAGKIFNNLMAQSASAPR